MASLSFEVENGVGMAKEMEMEDFGLGVLALSMLRQVGV